MRKYLLIASIAFPLAALAEPGGHRFDRFDSDGDGQISLDEFRNLPHRHSPPGDANDDGNVTHEELTAHLADQAARQAQRMAERAERANEHFALADANGDGAVSPDEAQAAGFARLDADGDGGISPAEMRRGADHGPRKGPRGKHRGKRGDHQPRHHAPRD